jgi:PLP dependent protein
MSAIASNLQAVLQRVESASQLAGRPAKSIRLVAVSKTFAAGSVLEAVDAGQRCFGENYPQEAVDKIIAVRTRHAGVAPPAVLEWHMIGPVQSNKTRLVAEHFDWVHSIDRLRIAQRLSDQRPRELPVMKVCLQVNIDDETTKSGAQVGTLEALADEVAGLPGLELCGLMCIPAPSNDPARQRKAFGQLRGLRDLLQRRHPGCIELSMGMSSDLEAAIAEGATMVRVGTAIFGARHHA